MLTRCSIPAMGIFLSAVTLVFLSTGYRSEEGIAKMPAKGKNLPVDCYEAAVDDNGEDLFVCVWSERTPDHGKIVGAILRKEQTTDFKFIDMSESEEDCQDVFPSVCWLDRKTIFLVWQRDWNKTKRIVGRLFTSDGHAITPVLPVSDTTITQFAMNPFVQSNRRGDALVAWQDYRNGVSDVYSQLYSAKGSSVGKNTRVSDDNPQALEGVPTISSNNDKTFLILWIDNRIDGRWAYFFQRWSNKPEGRNALLDSAQKKDMTMIGRAVWTGKDRAIFVWKDYRAGNSDIYLRSADIRTNKISPATKVNDDPGERWQRLPVLDLDKNGNSIVCWEDYRNTEINQLGDIYAQAYSPSRKRHGANFKVNEGDNRISRKNPQIAMTPGGACLIVWHQISQSRKRIMGQWFEFPSKPIGTNFIVSKDEK